jgi:putative restriction endonuclease
MLSLLLTFRLGPHTLMKLYVGITDHDWFKLHASKESVDEVSFWRPSPTNFKALEPNELFLFKIKGKKAIGGGGFFTKFLRVPISLAWQAFGEANGARSLIELRKKISEHRQIAPNEDPVIGWILLAEPFFFEERDWIPLPDDFKHGIQKGKQYQLDYRTGDALWREVALRLERAEIATPGPATMAAQEGARFGKPRLVAPRLGQGTFRLSVTDEYRYRCAITLERTLPVLQAAHIRPFSEDGTHELSNGLLLRSDLHTLFDLKYMTIDPKDKTVVVSRRIREEFENGRAYYELIGRRLADPQTKQALPSVENLKYHFDQYHQWEASVRR